MKRPILLLTSLTLLLPFAALAQTAPAATSPAAATAPTATTATPPAGAKASGSSSATLPAGTIFHINSAPAQDLMKLPGVSAKIAAEIVKNRPYKNSKELVKKVKGIGAHNVKKILPFIDFN